MEVNEAVNVQYSVPLLDLFAVDRRHVLVCILFALRVCSCSLYFISASGVNKHVIRAVPTLIN